MMSSAVWAIIGVWLLESMVPLDSMKSLSAGSCSMSEGTFGLSRLKWTLSKVISMTCLTPLASWQPAPGAGAATAAVTGGPASIANTPARVKPPTRTDPTATRSCRKSRPPLDLRLLAPRHRNEAMRTPVERQANRSLAPGKGWSSIDRWRGTIAGENVTEVGEQRLNWEQTDAGAW